MFLENPHSPKRISSSSSGIIMRHDDGLRRDPQRSAIPTPRFSRNLDVWNSTRRSGGTYSQKWTMETPRYAISKFFLKKQISDPDEFQVLVSQLQDRSKRKQIYSRSKGDDWIYRRSFDVVIKIRKIFSWFWDSWYEDCVCGKKN